MRERRPHWVVSVTEAELAAGSLNLFSLLDTIADHVSIAVSTFETVYDS